ncbi:LysE family translocator [Plasticicumulans acidivorans]|uniref:Threonine/homoserine/homoserine lactone efflux protein n=1 Tax=Plasticicumulans acidivorans TaxID=886464 RepID=A0A317MUF1_9GAMM|nr:LysE family translocator [Plasticicumulans acidivorans]PWV61626.1 threonine/homoserine/homoserine lactone efflux protein [Plasticicumulans acidivorans]
MFAAIHDFPAFLAAALLLAVLPGPDTMYVIGRTVAQGRRAGLASLAGISVGCIGHVSASALGLSALIAASPLAFGLLKTAGALYLAWLGVQLLREAWRQGDGVAIAAAGAPDGAVDGGRLFRQGIVTNLLNPKVGLFFVSFLPQFVQPGPGTVWSFAALGLCFVGIGIGWMLVLMHTTDLAARAFRGRTAVQRWLKAGTGSLFVGLAARLALDR